MKKVLIITYYWPPSGGGGVQRWLKFVKYLNEFNWQPIVFTPEDPDFELNDESLLSDVPANLKVIKRPIWEPFAIYRKFLGKKAVQKQGVVASDGGSWLARLSIWIRGNYFVPDSRVFWVRPSVNYLSKYLKANPVEVVITTGPPHSLHLIGLELKKRINIKWVADFRDPWSKWDVLDQLKLTKRTRKNHSRLEHLVLTSADLILTVSPSLESSLKMLGASNIKMITNGWDFEQMDQDEGSIDKFRVSHIGLLNKGRNPKILWQVLEEIAEEDESFGADLEVYLAGTIEREVIDQIATYPLVSEKLRNKGYLPHEEVISVYQQSAVLLLLINNTDNAKWILPGKMYEYMSFGKPILSLGMPKSDATTILINAGFTPCIEFSDKKSIKNHILASYKIFREKESQSQQNNIRRYHRKELTKELAGCLDTL